MWYGRRVAARRRCGALGALLVGAFGSGPSGCILHTDSINSPPEVVKIAPVGPLVTGTNVFEAEVRDADQAADTLTITWRKGAGLCPTTLDGAQRGGTILEPDTHPARAKVPIQGLASFCLWAVATDDHGAAGFNTREISPVNLPPGAEITVVRSRPSRWTAGQYELYSTFQLAPPKPDSDDPVTYRWTVADPSGKTSDGIACPPPDARDICFTADLPGEYKVTLLARDQAGQMTPGMMALLVEQDRPPCIRVESAMPRLGLPTFSRPLDDPVLFEITVDDDGDPYPEVEGRLSDHEFVWFVRGPQDTQFVRQSSGSSPQLNTFRLAPRFTFGDEVLVRVQYKDRVRDRDFGACHTANPDSCALRPGVPACYQWVTWKIQYKE